MEKQINDAIVERQKANKDRLDARALSDESDETYRASVSKVERLQQRFDIRVDHEVSVEKEEAKKREARDREEQQRSRRVSECLETGFKAFQEHVVATLAGAAGDVSQGREERETRKGGPDDGGAAKGGGGKLCIACVTVRRKLESPP